LQQDVAAICVVHGVRRELKKLSSLLFADDCVSAWRDVQCLSNNLPDASAAAAIITMMMMMMMMTALD